MDSKINRILPSALTRRRSKDTVTQNTRKTCLPESPSHIGIMDMDTHLFFNDFENWYAKTVVQYHLAMAIQTEHIEPTSISPKCVIEQVEACYGNPCGENTINPSSPGSLLFSCIKSARSTKDEATLQNFLDRLKSNITRSCRRLRNEKVVELDAGILLTPQHTRRAATPSSTVTNEQSSEDTAKETGTPIPSDTSSLDEAVQNTTVSEAGNLPPYRYTTAIYEHAALHRAEIDFRDEWISDRIWRCTASYDGIHEIGEAESKKSAKHIASQKLCRTLRICD